MLSRATTTHTSDVSFFGMAFFHLSGTQIFKRQWQIANENQKKKKRHLSLGARRRWGSAPGSRELDLTPAMVPTRAGLLFKVVRTEIGVLLLRVLHAT